MQAPAPDPTPPCASGYAGLYVHIPFCRRKCAYCDFASYPGLEHLFDDYIQAVCTQIEREARAWAETCFDTIFVGGGTPTLLPVSMNAALLRHCQHHLTLSSLTEITIEANPGTIVLADLCALHSAGFNRLSLGVQSLNDQELQLLGRIHSAQEAINAFSLAREAGFANINLDLIYGLPDQSLARWRETLQRAIALQPEHLSLYALTLEEGTPLAARIQAGAMPAIEDDLVAAMYETAETLLAHSGYVHYEISNWARRSALDREGEIPALACQHNLKYWRNERYLGVGAAAHSFDGRRRYANHRDVVDYITQIVSKGDVIAECEELSSDERMGETMMLGLRLMTGVSWDEFAQRHRANMAEVYEREIGELVEAGLLLCDARGLRLTPRGRLLGNRVFAAFLR